MEFYNNESENIPPAIQRASEASRILREFSSYCGLDDSEFLFGRDVIDGEVSLTVQINNLPVELASLKVVSRVINRIIEESKPEEVIEGYPGSKLYNLGLMLNLDRDSTYKISGLITFIYKDSD